jgi:hypothetical protein
MKPTEAEWRELQRRADMMANGCSVHAVRTIMGWLRDLYNAPKWGGSMRTLWDWYVRQLNCELAGVKP